MAAVPDAWARRLLDSTARVGPGRFLDSVASGDPAADAMTFWSRLTTDRPRSGARLVVARDESLRNVVAEAVVPTGAAMDHCLKTRVGGLQPGTVYWYAWQSGDDLSPVGRTKTANAADSRDRVRLAVSSCQNFDDGFFTGHTHAAAQPIFDLVIFAGDYTYETRDSGTREDPADSNDLGSYRDKLRLYRSDAGLREVHRLHPCAHIWDDHEVADNYTDNDPRASDLQRTAGYRASFEWLPRMTFPQERFRTYKPLPLGRSAEVIALDQRQYRTREGDANSNERIAFLGDVQMNFLKDRLARLQQTGVTWKVLANQLPVFPINGIGQPGLQNDQWEGYKNERTELLTFIRDQGIENVVFVTGDIHTYITSELTPEFNPAQFPPAGSSASVAVDYVCGSITSTGFPSVTESAVRATSPHIKQFNGTDHGYGALDMGADRLVTEYRAGPIDRPDAPVGVIERFTQNAGEATFDRESDPVARAAQVRRSALAARAAGAAERADRSAAARRRRATVARAARET
jgi:phosphodiesterase/alkaline phosphatase D-like protein